MADNKKEYNNKKWDQYTTAIQKIVSFQAALSACMEWQISFWNGCTNSITTKGVASTPKTELQRCMNNENTMNLHSEPKQMEAKTANKSLL